MIYIAHRSDDGTIQTVKEHSEEVAARSRDGAIAELREACHTIGLLHDIGKYQPSFQARINGQDIRVEHSICGARECLDRFGKTPLGLLAGLCIAGHHTGIPDCGISGGDTAEMTTFFGRLKRQCEDYSAFTHELELPEQAACQAAAARFTKYLKADCTRPEDLIEKYAFLVRYCFSCLTDADSLDTALVTGGEPCRSLTADFEACLRAVDARLHSFHCETELQRARADLQAQAFAKSERSAEIYLLNMPTGSGKTLCSIKFALERAIRMRKRRIIYVIPFTSIIDQTADEFERIFGSHAQILRHQSTFSYEDEADSAALDEDYRRTAKYAVENWDAQIIITTAVQFFESIAANKRNRLRKVHNLADSVLVFDEAHLMPTKYLQTCLRSIAYITKYLNSEAIFLTATMPDFRSLLSQYALPTSAVIDLIDDRSHFPRFAKCRYTMLGTISDEALLAHADAPSNLIVVNSRKGARAIFEQAGGRKYHLSTYMTAFDRARVIAEIRAELDRLEADFPNAAEVPPERRLTVVSTSLIEAGIDLDFHRVYRELTGLDSILQAGGRCNREGRRPIADVWIFERAATEGRAQSDDRAQFAKGIIAEFSDISSPEAIRTYYDRLFAGMRDELSAHSISKLCTGWQSIPFAEYNMKLIDTPTIAIAVECDETSRELIRELDVGNLGKIRALRKYCCTVYPYEFADLLSQGAIRACADGVYCLSNPDYYDPELGILFEGRDIYL